MTPVEMLRSLLVNDPTVSGLVGQRVYADVAPQGSDLPFIVLTVENGTAEDCLDGPVGYFSDTLGFDCYTKSRIDSLHLWKAGWAVLVGHSGYNSVTIIDSVTQASGIAWDHYRLDDASDELVYRCAQNLQVNYSFK